MDNSHLACTAKDKHDCLAVRTNATVVEVLASKDACQCECHAPCDCEQKYQAQLATLEKSEVS